MKPSTRALLWAIVLFVVSGFCSANDGVVGGFQGYLHVMAYVALFAGIAVGVSFIGDLWKRN